MVTIKPPTKYTLTFHRHNDDMLFFPKNALQLQNRGDRIEKHVRSKRRIKNMPSHNRLIIMVGLMTPSDAQSSTKLELCQRAYIGIFYTYTVYITHTMRQYQGQVVTFPSVAPFLQVFVHFVSHYLRVTHPSLTVINDPFAIHSHSLIPLGFLHPSTIPRLTVCVLCKRQKRYSSTLFTIALPSVFPAVFREGIRVIHGDEQGNHRDSISTRNATKSEILIRQSALK